MELSRLSSDLPLDEVFQRACEISSKAVGVERVGIWLFSEDRSLLHCVDLYERSKDKHSSGAILHVADFPTYFASLTIRKSVPAEVAIHEPWTAELAEKYLIPLGISSILDAAIYIDGDMLGVVCHEHVGEPREWTTEDRDFAGSIADLLAVRYQSARVRDLNSAFLTERERVSTFHKAKSLEMATMGVIHDINTLMSVLLSHGYILSERTDTPPDVREHGKEIYSVAKRISELNKQLLEIAHPENSPPSVCDLAELSKELLPTLRTTIGPYHSLVVSMPEGLGKVFVNKSQFARLLLNLLVNARDAMPNGGQISVSLQTESANYPRTPRSNYLVLIVRDEGVGMDLATKRRMFEPFFSAKESGTGLGLVVVEQIVDRIGGFTKIESEPGKGTTFQVYFPIIGNGNKTLSTGNLTSGGT